MMVEDKLGTAGNGCNMGTVPKVQNVPIATTALQAVPGSGERPKGKGSGKGKGNEKGTEKGKSSKKGSKRDQSPGGEKQPCFN